MLVELVVENYAVIERLRVRFHPGLNLLTGETGSGKSIVVDALALLFGGRAGAGVVRSGAERARISGVFELPPLEAVRAALDAAGIEPEDNELLIEREIQAGGKSRAFAASRPVTAALLRDLAPYLGDIHGQHDQQRLFSAGAQLEMLDAFAGEAAAVEAVAAAYAGFREAARALEEIERMAADRERLAALYQFELKLLDEADLKPGEDAALEQEKRFLNNVVRLEEHANGAYGALYDSPQSALAQIRAARRHLEEIARIDPHVAPLVEALPPAEAALNDAAHELRSYLGRLEADPARLDEVEQRLAALDKIKRRFGQSLEQAIGYRDDLRGKAAQLESLEDQCAKLRRDKERAAGLFEQAAARLTAVRQAAAAELSKRVERELAGLAMERSRFETALSPAPWSASGADAATFLISTNPGEVPRPLEEVASGGELSRVALALKTCTAVKPEDGQGPVRTLVFDEVDAGIGGRAAETVGRRLKQLARNNQVLCVTHLPQIAGFADHHYVVEKRESGGRTTAVITELEPRARVAEIGRMLSGETVTPEALKNAEQLLRLGREA